MFTELGDKVSDYHNDSSTCSGYAGVSDGISDDIEGLIEFVRGKDYFAYNGCDNMDEIRDHVLGDIYHSQVLEVGPPSADINYTRNNQENCR